MTHYLTQSGLEELQQELKTLTEVEMPRILEDINVAMAEGDLRENAPLEAAKNERDNVSVRIDEIEEILANYEIIEESSTTSKTVTIGNEVVVEYSHNNIKFTLKIVGSSEADALNRKISNDSPLAVAIIGKKKGQEASFKVKDKEYQVKIIEIV